MLTAEAILARGFEIPQSRLYPLYQILDARKADENASERANQGQSTDPAVSQESNGILTHEVALKLSRYIDRILSDLGGLGFRLATPYLDLDEYEYEQDHVKFIVYHMGYFTQDADGESGQIETIHPSSQRTYSMAASYGDGSADCRTVDIARLVELSELEENAQDHKDRLAEVHKALHLAEANISEVNDDWYLVALGNND